MTDFAADITESITLWLFSLRARDEHVNGYTLKIKSY